MDRLVEVVLVALQDRQRLLEVRESRADDGAVVLDEAGELTCDGGGVDEQAVDHHPLLEDGLQDEVGVVDQLGDLGVPAGQCVGDVIRPREQLVQLVVAGGDR